MSIKTLGAVILVLPILLFGQTPINLDSVCLTDFVMTAGLYDTAGQNLDSIIIDGTCDSAVMTVYSSFLPFSSMTVTYTKVDSCNLKMAYEIMTVPFDTTINVCETGILVPPTMKGDVMGLSQGALPNPFKSTVWLYYRTPADIPHVTVRIFDSRGRLIRDFGMVPTGTGQLAWDGSGPDGRAVSAGRYVCRLSAGDKVHSLSLTKIQ